MKTHILEDAFDEGPRRYRCGRKRPPGAHNFVDCAIVDAGNKKGVTCLVCRKKRRRWKQLNFTWERAR